MHYKQMVAKRSTFIEMVMSTLEQRHSNLGKPVAGHHFSVFKGHGSMLRPALHLDSFMLALMTMQDTRHCLQVSAECSV